MSTRLCDLPSFRKFVSSLDPKFSMPHAARINTLIVHKMNTATQRIKEMVQQARKLTLCIDGWSKKGLMASFLGISACFYHSPTNQAQHALLSLRRICHPHTGQALANAIDSTLDEWDITEDKVMIIVTDNGANIVKAIDILRKGRRQGEYSAQQFIELDSTESESDSDIEEEEMSISDQESTDFFEDGDISRFRRMPCMAHTLQLALKDAMKQSGASSAVNKARNLIHSVRKSSVANEQMIKRCDFSLFYNTN
ncbi:uncharacterized protein LOC114648790 [Erpetoichthys calabaricus]|uniref:uncharacterized protein LOC114648790 n=1 Tax=Erpetoichthys calabaricus TaxID=27687 RepID=UPI002234BCBC|nr:uncharacterized protein LOC114648790 [Erpetoichthys calabaricus]